MDKSPFFLKCERLHPARRQDAESDLYYVSGWNARPSRHGVPRIGRRKRSKPYQPATRQASTSKTENAKSIGLELALPDIMNDQFINPPPKAAMPVKRPMIRATPIKISEYMINGPNHVCHSASIMNCRYVLHQSNETRGRPSAGIDAALVQNPRIASPLCQAGFSSL